MQLTWKQAIGLETSHLVPFSDTRHQKLLVHKDLISPLSLLLNAAEKDGVAIKVVSGFRSFERQLAIWNDKWQGFKPVYSRHGRPLNVQHMSDIEKYKAICLWSAIPGLSRHHWGTDFDIFAFDAIESGHKVELIPEEFSKTGPCYQLQEWLNDNLIKFGFYRPYRTFRQGVCEEPWHISFHSVASKILSHFDYLEWKHYVKRSQLKSADFIIEQLSHYQEKYFCNLCDTDLKGID